MWFVRNGISYLPSPCRCPIWKFPNSITGTGARVTKDSFVLLSSHRILVMFASSAMEKVALEWVHRLGRYRYAIRCWSNQKKLDARQREQSSYGCRQKSYCAGQKAEHVHASLYVMLSHAARKWCGERRGTKFSSNCTFSFDWIRELQGEKLQKSLGERGNIAENVHMGENDVYS